MQCRNILVMLSLALSALRCQCIIILDRGNPARFIRGTFIDINQPEFSGVSESESQPNTFSMTQQQLQTMSGNMIEGILENLNSYNQAMTDAIIAQAKDITPLASVNMCRFARTRMSALRIMNIFEALRVQAATHSTDTVTSNIMTENLRAEVAAVSSEFILMEHDLHQFDEVKLGDSPMEFFARAMRDFTALQTTLSGFREGIIESAS